MIWCCPRCQQELVEIDGGLRCESCVADYESVAGIPDLRLPGPSWIDFEADKAQASRLLADMAGASAAELVRHVFGSRPGWDEAQVELRTRQVLGAPERLRADINGWLQPCVRDAGLFLDVGCGPGVLLAAAAAEGREGIGIDVSLVWLVVAQRLISEWGGKPLLAAALAEALPLDDATVSGVAALDVIEHVADKGRLVKEMNRVTVPGGCVALSTPNRYSLAAEPHVCLWGVGWLPGGLQDPYVRWRSGKSYQHTRLLSAREASSLIRRHTQLRAKIVAPPIPTEEIAWFPAHRAMLARIYNHLVALSWLRWLFLGIGPFFRIVGKKS